LEGGGSSAALSSVPASSESRTSAQLNIDAAPSEPSAQSIVAVALPPATTKTLRDSDSAARVWGMAGRSETDLPSLPPIRIGGLDVPTICSAVRAGSAVVLAKVGEEQPVWWRLNMDGANDDLDGRWTVMTTENRLLGVSEVGLSLVDPVLAGPLRASLGRQVGSGGEIFLYFNDALADQLRSACRRELTARSLADTWRTNHVVIHARLDTVSKVVTFNIIDIAAAQR
jgi:hypothetical protein